LWPETKRVWPKKFERKPLAAFYSGALLAAMAVAKIVPPQQLGSKELLAQPRNIMLPQPASDSKPGARESIADECSLVSNYLPFLLPEEVDHMGTACAVCPGRLDSEIN
jgi:hypothetical protein